LQWRFSRGPNGGSGQILIDRNATDTVDQYHATRSTGWRNWTRLGPGRHTNRFAMLAARNPAAVHPAIHIGAIRFPRMKLKQEQRAQSSLARVLSSIRSKETHP
jgi:hypothetical protein